MSRHPRGAGTRGHGARGGTSRLYGSTWLTPTLAKLQPDLVIDAAAEPNPPAIGEGVESPYNLGRAWGGTLSAEQSTASNQPIWRGPGQGYEFGGDDHWNVGGLTTFRFLHETGGTILCVVSLASLADALEVLFSTSFTVGEAGMALAYENRDSNGAPDALRLVHSSGTGLAGAITDTLSNSGVLAEGVFAAIGASYDGSTYRFSVDGDSAGSGSWSPNLRSVDQDNVAEIGRTPTAGGIAELAGHMLTPPIAMPTILDQDDLNQATAELAKIKGLA